MLVCGVSKCWSKGLYVMACLWGLYVMVYGVTTWPMGWGLYMLVDGLHAGLLGLCVMVCGVSM